MFIAIDQLGNKLNPLDTPEEELRLLSKSKMLFCPECSNVLRFAAGEKVTAHFKHVNSPDCTYDSEPETEEHLRGKVLIRNWILQQYPNVQVEFEYKIRETNQRADVMAIFPTGEKIAFEMQCSKIQGSVWRDRHYLYKKAGIKDYWILGKSVHKYGKTEGTEDTLKHQLVSLASEIFTLEGSVIFLDTKCEYFSGLYRHKFIDWHSDTILRVTEESFPLTEARIHNTFISTTQIKKDYEEWHLEKERKEKLAREREERYLREQEREEKAKVEYLKLRHQEVKRYLENLNSITLDSIKKTMTPKEIDLFERLLRKHGYNDNNFPGIFNVHSTNNPLIYTPQQLWQLWIYDKYIYKKMDRYDKVWIPKIKDEFYNMYKKGIFRLKYKAGDNHFSFAIYDYFEALGYFDIVSVMGAYSTKYHRINFDVLPPFSGKEVNNHIAYFLTLQLNPFIRKSDLNQEIVETVLMYGEMIKKYREERPIMNKDEVSTLEYTNNLLQANQNLGNDWEREFISKMLNLQRSGYVLSDKQKDKVSSIVKRIENQLGISLTIN